jgi:hypothetical protein
VTADRPIFVFAAGWRSGSTLLQRLLCSHPDIHVWGENRGICQYLQAVHAELLKLDWLSARAAREFEALGPNGWIAMLNPPRVGFLAGIAALMDTHFGIPVRRMGKSRWGFKEVRHGTETVRFLHHAFPHARFVLLVRNPQDCLASARAATVCGPTDALLSEIGGATPLLDHWTRIAASFLEPLSGEIAMHVRYEDVLAEPDAFLDRLSVFLDVARDGLSSTVLSVRRRGWLEQEPRLTDSDWACLDNRSLWEVAGKYGYSPRSKQTGAAP